MDESRVGHCKTCPAFYETGGGRGECRAWPPHPLTDAAGYGQSMRSGEAPRVRGAFPGVSADDFCMQHPANRSLAWDLAVVRRPAA